MERSRHRTLLDPWVRTFRVHLEEMMDTEEAEALARTMVDSVTVDSKSIMKRKIKSEQRNEVQ